MIIFYYSKPNVYKKNSILDFYDNESLNHHKDIIGTEKDKHLKCQELIKLILLRFFLEMFCLMEKCMYIKIHWLLDHSED